MTDKEYETAMYEKLAELQNLLTAVSELHSPHYVKSADHTIYRAICKECCKDMNGSIPLNLHPSYPCDTIKMIWGNQ